LAEKKQNKFLHFFYIVYWKVIGEDIDTVKYIMKQTKEGKPVLDPEKTKQFVKYMKHAPMEILKGSWYWVLAIIFAFAMGSLVGMRYTEVQCNNFIIDNFYNDSQWNLPVVSPSLPVFPSYIGHNYSEEENNKQDSPVNPTRQGVP